MKEYEYLDELISRYPVLAPVKADIRTAYETMKECREVTEKYRTGRSAYLRLGQLFMRLFAGLL